MIFSISAMRKKDVLVTGLSLFITFILLKSLIKDQEETRARKSSNETSLISGLPAVETSNAGSVGKNS
ncbi:MAG: hypothetical protein ACFFD4_13850 [Candidatus Odinarchaeota archaeon]